MTLQLLHSDDALIAVEPPEPFRHVKRRIAECVWRCRDEILGLAHRIHAAPELAFEEVQASGWIAEAIARHGYHVEQPAGRLPTAVRGVIQGGRAGEGARVAILAEYDALPGLGHGCGHNLMAASGVGAAIALAASGRVEVDDLVTARYALDETESALRSTRSEPGVLKAVVQPGSPPPP